MAPDGGFTVIIILRTHYHELNTKITHNILFITAFYILCYRGRGKRGKQPNFYYKIFLHAGNIIILMIVRCLPLQLSRARGCRCHCSKEAPKGPSMSLLSLAASSRASILISSITIWLKSLTHQANLKLN